MIEKIHDMAAEVADYLLSIPIEIRHSDFALVDRASIRDVPDVLSKLDTGEYYVSITLPNAFKVGMSVSVDSESRS